MRSQLNFQFCIHFFFLVGNHAACINAATMALIDAGVPMKEYVCACNAGYIEDTPLVGELKLWNV